jgi:biopolymer transport protein TolQ
VGTDLSFTHLIANASLIVQLVMLLLVLISLASWTLIFRKGAGLRDARAAARDFEERFWSGGDLGGLHREVAEREGESAGLENIFQAGFQEFARLRGQKGMEPMDVVEGAQRAMRVSLSREVDGLEQHLSFLATVGSTSPYIGLFGTVWGIMNAFRGLANAQQATLAMVAPGIAEALIATAMGLFAAIPAVVAYNRYANEAERLISHYESFIDEFASILQRQAHP